MLSLGREPEPNLGIGQIVVRLAKRVHGYDKERVLEVDREKITQRLRTVSGLRALAKAVHEPMMVPTSPIGSPPSVLALECARADAVDTVERDGMFRHVCVCV